jgi:hypothetical protein
MFPAAIAQGRDGVIKVGLASPPTAAATRMVTSTPAGELGRAYCAEAG